MAGLCMFISQASLSSPDAADLVYESVSVSTVFISKLERKVCSLVTFVTLLQINTSFPGQSFRWTLSHFKGEYLGYAVL